jgi:hypothetical protein
MYNNYNISKCKNDRQDQCCNPGAPGMKDAAGALIFHSSGSAPRSALRSSSREGIGASIAIEVVARLFA